MSDYEYLSPTPSLIHIYIPPDNTEEHIASQRQRSFFLAARSGNRKDLRELLELDINVDEIDDNKMTALHIAVQMRRTKLITHAFKSWGQN